MDKFSQDFAGRYLIERQSGRQRIANHLLFWLAFLAFHLAFFVPHYKDIDFNKVWIVSYSFYYFRFIPVFYLSTAVYLYLRRYISGGRLFVATLLSMAALMHLFTALVFNLLDQLYAVGNLSAGFKILQSVYGKPFWQRSGVEWLYFIYDFQEIQVLFLPLGLKMIKLGVRAQLLSRDLKNQQLQNELVALRSQPSPHFILNALDAAYTEILPIKKSVAEYLENLIDVLQFSLRQSRNQWTSLHGEFEIVLSYVKLESRRFSNRLEVSVFQNGPLTEQQQIPTLVLLTLTENAFKHGVYPNYLSSHLQIELKTEPGWLSFKITNSIPTHPVNKKKERGSGIGLKNTRKRLEMYFPGNHSFEITKTKSDFSVHMRIPIRETSA
ncbi:sensor histidine kinase [Dyadobacter subterraneus]|uniref:Histidine kinase n=1 Tax=Dyadobacter subterraneus TaxID=2773304 RepID=A0ABR9W9J6_9BACT|nr:histidine kinase [Dyadobacter subterraneus]MBE9462130.1 histidine kinase [Dyadobacter subterraneus]